MRPYTNSLALVTPAFPGSIYIPRERLNRANDYAPIAAETGTVPGSANAYTITLDFGILAQAGLTVTDTTATQILVNIPFEQSPAADEVAVKFDQGLLKFHSSRT